MISFQNITKVYKSGISPISALEDVSFEINQGEFVSIVGRSGAGKTTLFKLFLAEEKPTSGQIFYEGQDVHKIKSEQLPYFRRRIGAVFQDYKLLGTKTVHENVAYIMEVMGATEREINKDVTKVLEITGLAERANNFPEELSGGERQRAAIARALIHRPDIILADEPTGNLDPFHTKEIIKLLDTINQMGTTVLLATHNKDIINTLKKRVVTLEQGRIIRDEERGKFAL
ncbi:MAG: cell division ATP-binding protein FtsE [Candidatus Nealsonbacteria bacterium]|nr:cell division ATP-binding protein FtsE [Candidatus Nealsonbacteria bacterium]